MENKEIILLGIRGIPASHGGFETFAEYLSLYLVARGWSVTVYCQEDGAGSIYYSEWEGVKRIHIPVKSTGPLGTIIFDFKSVMHSLRYNGVFLTLGYNTAIFNVLHRVFLKKNIINMDGIEWKRKKWGFAARTWFWLNERIGCWTGNVLVADHPEIENHLARRVSRDKITMIPYGGKQIETANVSLLSRFEIEKNSYALVVARPEPENSILEIVQAFSRSKRGGKLVVLGNYEPDSNSYHQKILESASNQVLFPGAIYESATVDALRFFCRFYVHGHQVGGTNPSLVEALGAGNAVLAHDNKFNRWVVKDGAIYFNDIDSASNAFSHLFNDNEIIAKLRSVSRKNFKSNFQWDNILKQYESLLIHIR